MKQLDIQIYMYYIYILSNFESISFYISLQLFFGSDHGEDGEKIKKGLSLKSFIRKSHCWGNSIPKFYFRIYCIYI